MSPAALQYIARSAAFETARQFARGTMTADEAARWADELHDLYQRIPEAERGQVLTVGAPSTRAQAMNEFFGR